MASKRPVRYAAFIGVDLRDVRVALDGRPVLRGINWKIRPRQRWILIGPNGAGKTLLLKLIAGDVWPSGTHGGTRSYRYRGEQFVDPNGVKSHIAYLGAERQDRYEHYDWNHRVEAIVGTGVHRTDIALDPLTTRDRARVGAWLRRLRIESLARRRFLTLSYGERRLVLLARALASSPKLLLLDELLNGLDARNRAAALQCIESLSRSALPWVLSTHRGGDIPRTATHLCVIESGRVTAQGRLRRREPLSLTAMATSARATSAPDQRTRRRKRDRGSLIRLNSANVWREGVCVLRGLTLSIERGDCWVVHGPNGSGKSSLIQLLYGDLSVARGGSVSRDGVEAGVPVEIFKRRVGLVAPELQAIHPRYLSASDVVCSGAHASIGLNERAGTRERVRAARALRGVSAEHLTDRAVRTLSYGQMRRVLFARALLHDPDMLLLDEPYAGLDAGTRRALRARVQAATESGVTVVIATHHRDEWPQPATHEIELERGRMLYCGPLRPAVRSRARQHR